MLALAVILTLHAGAGWFDDAFALDGAGGRLAVVHAAPDGALDLELRDVDRRGAVVARARLAAAPATIVFTRGGVLVVGAGGATLYDDALRPRARFQGDDIVAADDVIAVVTRDEIALYDPEHPQRPVTVRSPGKLADFEPLYSRAGYTRVVGRHLGRFDRALDRRLPDTEGTYDVARGTFTDRPIDDPVAWLRRARERASHPGQDTFVRGSSVVTADDQVIPLPFAPDRVQEAPDGQLILESGGALYRFDPAAVEPGKPERLAAVPAGALWHVAGGRLAVLERHRGVARGGVDLIVTDLRP